MMDASVVPGQAEPDRPARPCRAEWRHFLRALAEEVDAAAGAAGRDRLLVGVGRRMARLLPLPPVLTLDALEMEMNDALGAIGWGSVRLSLHEFDRCLVIAHGDLPRLGSAGDPPGQWLAALLEGLYQTWMGEQPWAEPALLVRRQGAQTPGLVVLRYGRG